MERRKKSTKIIGNRICKRLLNITIGTRYARCGKVISDQFRSSLKSVIPKAKELDFEKYGFSEKEIKVFKEEIQEAESLISSCKNK